MCIRDRSIYSFITFFFKQKTAYEIGVRLVGSEMCIRDRLLPRVSDIDDVKQKNKNHETIPSIFFPEQKTKRSFVLRHLCPVHEVLTEKPKFVGCKIRGMRS